MLKLKGLKTDRGRELSKNITRGNFYVLIAVYRLIMKDKLLISKMNWLHVKPLQLKYTFLPKINTQAEYSNLWVNYERILRNASLKRTGVC